MYLADPIERMEAAVDRMESEMDAGDDGFTCLECKRRIPWEEAEPYNSRPDSPIGCADCVDRYFEELKKEKDT